MNKFIKNVSWIFAGNIIHAILQFLLNILIARMFTTTNYGIINYSASLIAFFISVGTLGFNCVITKMFSDNESNSADYLGSAIIYRSIFAIISIAILQIIVKLSEPTNTTLQIVTFFQSLSILFGSFDLIVYWFRFKSQANIVAILRLVAFFMSAIWRIIVLLTTKDLCIYVIGVSIESLFFGILLVMAFIKITGKRFMFHNSTAIELLALSYPFISSAIMTTVYGQVDKIMINSMINSTSVAYYSVSLTLAGAISIIPSTLIEGFRPDIMSYRNKNIKIYHKRLRQLYCIVFWGCVCYSVFITIFSKNIILLLYGSKYLAATSSLSLIVWYTSFSYFGAINNMYLVAENKSKWVQVITLIGAILNVILNYIFIPYLGVSGAALASLITQIVANFILQAIIPSLREIFKLIIDGILFHNIK